jgi:hypothetical protein
MNWSLVINHPSFQGDQTHQDPLNTCDISKQSCHRQTRQRFRREVYFPLAHIPDCTLIFRIIGMEVAFSLTTLAIRMVQHRHRAAITRAITHNHPLMTVMRNGLDVLRPIYVSHNQNSRGGFFLTNFTADVFELTPARH